MQNSQTEEIKAKIDLVDLVAEYIQLKQAGTNFRARCPFHNEKTPSFMVSRDKQIWHCFGCGEGGDAFSFVQKIESVEFPEALKILAQKAGIKLAKLDPQQVSQKTLLMDINKMAADYFHKVLEVSQEAQIARDYLQKRRLTAKTIKEFYLGYAPDSWDKLLNILPKKGFKTSDILLAGLIVKNEQGKVYDRFRQRLMFPIFDQNENIVGFTARILDESKLNQGGKYINTPQTPIYNKSLVIYGLDKAKNEIKKKNLAVIVEGNIDVIASHQNGVKNVIASSGTALTLEQLKVLKRFTNNLALAFDADLAGQIAAQRGIDTALSLGMNINVIQLPETIDNQPIKDPDDCLKHGVSHWKNAITQAISIMDYYFGKLFKQFDPNNPQDKKEISARLLKQIAKLTDKVEQTHWLNQLAQKLNVPETILHETFGQQIENRINNQEIQADNKKPSLKEELLAEQILALVLKYPQNLQYIIDHLTLEMIAKPELQQVYKMLILYYNSTKEFNYSEFEKIVHDQDPQIVNVLTTLMLLADKDFFDFKEQEIQKEIIQIITIIKKNYISNKIKQVEQLLIQAENQKNDQQIEALTKDFTALSEQINNL